jgi:hypothetical protein
MLPRQRPRAPPSHAACPGGHAHLLLGAAEAAAAQDVALHLAVHALRRLGRGRVRNQLLQRVAKQGGEKV